MLQLLVGHVPLIDAGAATTLFTTGAIGCLASTWLGNVPALRRQAE